jgi:putative Ca2+/H+ antiporter (TMEM165/GDT1 family)
VIFIGELPDKTMFASLVLASRGHPRSVWIGAAGAFLVHVVIATTIGVGLFALLPHRVVEGFVAILFLVGAVFAIIESRRNDELELIERETRSHRQVVVAAFGVIFIAEWGDLTQILTANLAAHYHSPFSVGLGAVLALWAVAGIAVVSGTGLMSKVPVKRVRQFTAAVLIVLAAIAGYSTITG